MPRCMYLSRRVSPCVAEWHVHLYICVQAGCFWELPLLCHLPPLNWIQVSSGNLLSKHISSCQAKIKRRLIVVSCRGKLCSVSLQPRGQATNSRAPPWRQASPDYASTSYWSLSNRDTDEVPIQAFHLSHHSKHIALRGKGVGVSAGV